MGCVDSDLAEADWGTMNDDMNAKLEKLAEEHALAVEWRGDDYGARKQYYIDMFLAGARAATELCQADAEKSVRERENA